MGFEPCYAEVLRVVQGKLHQPDEVQRGSFYAFSYYYDRAVDTDMIGEFTPGVSAGESWASLWWGREGTKEYLYKGFNPDLSGLVLPVATGRWVQALGTSCLIRMSVFFPGGLGHQVVQEYDSGGVSHGICLTFKGWRWRPVTWAVNRAPVKTLWTPSLR